MSIPMTMTITLPVTKELLGSLKANIGAQSYELFLSLLNMGASITLQCTEATLQIRYNEAVRPASVSYDASTTTIGDLDYSYTPLEGDPYEEDGNND
jgi:hypothetical protein